MQDERQDRQQTDEPTLPDVDPEEFLRALLKISPEDAAKVREDPANKTGKDQHVDSSVDDGG